MEMVLVVIAKLVILAGISFLAYHLAFDEDRKNMLDKIENERNI